MHDELTPGASTPSAYERDEALETVVGSVADAEGAQPLELSPLGTAIDVDALNSLFRDRTSDGSITFTYHGYRVHLTDSGAVTIDEIDD